MYRCRICSKEFAEIPPDAVEIAAKRRGTLYQFLGGEVHDLYRARSVSADHRWHRNPRWDCIFCYPPAKPELPVEQTQVVQSLVPEEQIMAKEEPDIDQLTAITILSAAFARVSKRNSH